MRQAFSEKNSKNSPSKARESGKLIAKFNEICRLASRLDLGQNVVDRAYSLVKEVLQKNILKNRSTHSIACACIYIACRIENVPRTFKETCAESKNSKREIGRIFKILLPLLHDTALKEPTGKFVARFCACMKTKSDFRDTATKIAERAIALDILPGRSPVTVVSAAIYMAGKVTNDKRTYKQISEVTKASPPSIKLAYDKMKACAAALV